MRDRLERAARIGRTVRIAREGIGAETVSAVPVAVGAALVLVRPEVDFRLDGYAALRLADVDGVRRGAAERFAERVLRAEGEVAGTVPAAELPPASDWAAFFAHLAAARRVVIVECEAADPDILHLGAVVAVAAGAVALRRVWRDGTWDDEPLVIRLADVTRARFGDRYSSVYGRYADPAVGPPPNDGVRPPWGP